jgi:hypothetical protein
MTDKSEKFMQISIDGASYHIPLQPFDPNDPALHVSLKPGSGPATWQLPIFANGVWYSVPFWPAT